jgi:hypothetical protein
MEAISSTDYETQPATSLNELQGADKGKDRLTDTLNSIGGDSAKEPKSAFQKMLQEQELKGVAKKAPKRGLQLGKPKAKTNQLLQELEKQQVITKDAQNDAAAGNKVEEEKLAENFNPLTENILMEIDERVTCQVTKDGDIEKFELKGILYLTLTDPKKCHAEVAMNFTDFKGLVFKVHPELDK